MSDKYILDGKEPVPVDDLLTWAKWYETADRTVARDYVGQILVSTVFLGLDHSWRSIFGGPEPPPILFETMVFSGVLGGHMSRYSTWEQAEWGHAFTLAEVREGFAQKALPAGDLIAVQYAIYDHPMDYPEHFVVRAWFAFADGLLQPDPACQLAETLDQARSLVPEGLTCLPRFEWDDPKIAEVWI